MKHACVKYLDETPLRASHHVSCIRSSTTPTSVVSKDRKISLHHDSCIRSATPTSDFSKDNKLSLSLSLSLSCYRRRVGFAALSLSSSRGLGFGAQDRMHFDKGPCMSRDISQRSETLSPLGRLRKGLQLQFLPELYFCCLFTDDMPGAWLLRRME